MRLSPCPSGPDLFQYGLRWIQGGSVPFDMAPVLISKTAPEDISLFQSLVNRSRISWVTFVKHRRLLVEFSDEIEMTYYIAAGFFARPEILLQNSLQLRPENLRRNITGTHLPISSGRSRRIYIYRIFVIESMYRSDDIIIRPYGLIGKKKSCSTPQRIFMRPSYFFCKPFDFLSVFNGSGKAHAITFIKRSIAVSREPEHIKSVIYGRDDHFFGRVFSVAESSMRVKIDFHKDASYMLKFYFLQKKMSTTVIQLQDKH